jgi:hypothetical protein
MKIIKDCSVISFPFNKFLYMHIIRFQDSVRFHDSSFKIYSLINIQVKPNLTQAFLIYVRGENMVWLGTGNYSTHNDFLRLWIKCWILNSSSENKWW